MFILRPTWAIVDKKNFKWANPASFIVYFWSFQTNITTFLQKIYVKNVHSVYGAGIQTHDPLEHESPPITTRPGLPPSTKKLAALCWWLLCVGTCLNQIACVCEWVS